MMTIRLRQAPTILALLVAAALTARPSLGGGVVIESVNSYSSTTCVPTNCATCVSGDLCNSIPNGHGFLTQVQASGLFSLLVEYTDRSVWDTDFHDPELVQPANDTSNFDQAASQISYFTGHGRGSAGTTPQYCLHDNWCTQPPAGTSLPGTCLSTPDKPIGTGTCTYVEDRSLLTHGSNDKWGGRVDYGGSFTHAVRYGENPTTGAWAGAGTNGGTNLVVLDLSWASIPGHQYQSLVPLLGGAHMVAATQPSWGDTTNVADRGPNFGLRAAQNPNGSVFQAWQDTLNSLPQGEGTGCGGAQTDFSHGGGHGFNGCGCNIIVTADSTQAKAQAHLTESWGLLASNALEAAGNSWWYWSASCNYAAFSTYPWNIP